MAQLRRIKPYSPWPDKRQIGLLLKYGVDTNAWREFLVQRRFKKCPYCGNEDTTSSRWLYKALHTSSSYLRFTCRKCDARIVPMIGTPLFNIKVPYESIFALIYIFMGQNKEARPAHLRDMPPLAYAASIELHDIAAWYSISHNTSLKVQRIARKIVWPEISDEDWKTWRKIGARERTDLSPVRAVPIIANVRSASPWNPYTQRKEIRALVERNASEVECQLFLISRITACAKCGRQNTSDKTFYNIQRDLRFPSTERIQFRCKRCSFSSSCRSATPFYRSTMPLYKLFKILDAYMDCPEKLYELGPMAYKKEFDIDYVSVEITRKRIEQLLKYKVLDVNR